MNSKLASLSLCLLAAAVTSLAEVNDSLEKQLFRHIAAIEARDMAEIEATITRGPRLLLILPSGKMTTTRDEYLKFHESLFANRDWAMTFDPVHVQRHGDYGHALFRVTFDNDGAGPAEPQPAYLSLGWKLEDGEWRLVHDQNTAIVLDKS